MSQKINLEEVTYRIVNEDRSIHLNNRYYMASPRCRLPKPGETIRITNVMPDNVTFNGKRFIIVNFKDYWFEV